MNIMKNRIFNKIELLASIAIVILLMSSCEYREIGDAPWPGQKIYMPAATYNNYMIDAVPSARAADPTPGFATRFLVDTVNRKFNVQLGVYRSGVDNKGSFPVDIAVNNDTINQLLAIAGKLPAGTELLPSDKYTIPESVQVNDGSDIGKFDLSVDLDYLLSNYTATGKTYAIAVGISCSQREVNTKYATTIIVINTKIMKPVASFTSAESVAVADTLTMNFTNTSKFGTKFTWNFGDGSPVMVTTNAKNEAVRHKYSTIGTYPVTLTVQGVADFAQSNNMQSANVQVKGI
jgi:hypothetical protein